MVLGCTTNKSVGPAFQLLKQDIVVFVDDIEIDGPFYNDDSPLFPEEEHFFAYVNLVKICNLLGADVKIDNKIIDITGGKIGKLVLNDDNEINDKFIYFSREDELALINTFFDVIINIDNEYFVQLLFVEFIIEGQLIQDNNTVILYTELVQELDQPVIPSTLNDCYLILNGELSEELKNEIKNTPVNDLPKFHMGLGMWIRNNFQLWSSKNTEIRQIFLNNNVFHPDDMSGIIIKGYHYYLNGIEKTIEELKR
jgi:hypothetical protein